MAERTVDHRAITNAVLEVSDLSVRYPAGGYGVTGLSVTLQPGEIVAMLGRNGAGKTSALRGIAGFIRSDRVTVTGSVAVAGHALRRGDPRRAIRSGLVLVQERDKVFASLTVAEHLRLVSKSPAEAEGPCRFEQLERLRGSMAGHLSGGERQMLALEVAMRCRPKVLLIDELSLGLAPAIVTNLMERLRTLVETDGVAMLIVEQDARAAIEVSDRIHILSNGRPVWSGPADEATPDLLAREYLGGGSE